MSMQCNKSSSDSKNPNISGHGIGPANAASTGIKPERKYT